MREGEGKREGGEIDVEEVDWEEEKRERGRVGRQMGREVGEPLVGV